MYIYVLYLYRVLERNSWWCRAGIRNRKSSERFVQSELVEVIQVWKVGHKTSQGTAGSEPSDWVDCTHGLNNIFHHQCSKQSKCRPVDLRQKKELELNLKTQEKA